MELDLAFVADRVAETDALLTYVIDNVRASTSWEDFKERLFKSIGEVKITNVIDVDKWLADKTAGYVVIMKCRSFPGEPAGAPTDYLRDDEGVPCIFGTRADALKNIPYGFEVVEIKDLSL